MKYLLSLIASACIICPLTAMDNDFIEIPITFRVIYNRNNDLRTDNSINPLYTFCVVPGCSLKDALGCLHLIAKLMEKSISDVHFDAMSFRPDSWPNINIRNKQNAAALEQSPELITEENPIEVHLE